MLDQIGFINSNSTEYQVQPIYRIISLGSNTSTVSATLDPNTFYDLETIQAKQLNITLNASGNAAQGHKKVVKEYMFQFTVANTLYASATSLTISIANNPTSVGTIKWAAMPLTPGAKGKTYQVSIVNNIGVCIQVDA